MTERQALLDLLQAHLPEDLRGAPQLESNLNLVLGLLEAQFSSEDRATLGRGAVKNLNDNPAFLAWIARSVASLSATPLRKLFTNLILGTAVGRAAASDVSYEKYGHSGPITLVVNPTMRCNLRCTGCYSYNYLKNGDMAYETLAKVLSEARQLGIRFVTVSGGEPLLYPDIFRMAEEFSDLVFLMYTNSTMIDESAAARIAAAGNLLPGISVEGFREHTDTRRGEGVHEAVLRAMRNLRREGVFFGFSATPTRLNAEVLASDAFVDEYLGQGALFGWMFNYIPVGRSPDVTLMPTPEQRNRVREATLRWQKTRPLFIGDFWNDGACVGGCLSASRYCYITVEGYVQPCTFVPFYTHRVQEHSLEEIFESRFFRCIRDSQPYHSNLLRPCKIIDHPEDLRRLVRDCEALPSYEGAEQVITDPEVTGFLDRYSEEYARIADRAWNGPDYQGGRSCLAPFLGRINVDKFFPDRMEQARRITREKEEAKAGKRVA